jgi:hypothetical protein
MIWYTDLISTTLGRMLHLLQLIMLMTKSLERSASDLVFIVFSILI